MRKVNKMFIDDTSFSCAECQWASKWAFLKHTPFHEEKLFPWEQVLQKVKQKSGWDYSHIAILSFSVFNLRAESIPVQTLDNRFIWDNVHVVT